MSKKNDSKSKKSEKGSSAVYAGSFDPITLGHLDVIKRAAKLFDRVIVAIGTSSSKKPFFDDSERVALVEAACKSISGVEARVFSGLAVEFAKKCGARSLVRGLRTEVDFTYEMQMALMNRALAPNLETIFIPTAQEYGHVSSSLVKEIASYGADTSSLVPPIVSRKLAEKYR